MEMDKYEVYRTFYNNNDKTLKVRYEKGALEDQIRRGMLRTDFIDEGYTKSDINKLIKKGWVKERLINFNGSHRAVVLWMDQEMTNPYWYKRLWKKLTGWIKK
jgi:hypothetical protein